MTPAEIDEYIGKLTSLYVHLKNEGFDIQSDHVNKAINLLEKEEFAKAKSQVQGFILEDGPKTVYGIDWNNQQKNDLFDLILEEIERQNDLL
jgi:hypothetical protein